MKLKATALTLVLAFFAATDRLLGAESCLPPPSGIVSWWGAESSALDSVGINNGTLAGGATFAAGKVGLAFAFTNGTSDIQIPDNPSLAFGANDFSIELWVKFTSLGGNHAFIAKDQGPGQVNKWIFLLNNGLLQFVVGSGASQTIAGSGAFTPVLNQWHHVAMARTGLVYQFYVDGSQVSADSGAAVIPTVNAPVTIGQAENAFFMSGMEDEVTIYNRALSAAEVLAIYNADSAGKCNAPLAPYFVTQPQNLTVFSGMPASLNALAAGSPPLSYQWRLNNTNVPGATNAAFTLTNVQPDQSGNYSVVASNTINSAISSNALLTVFPAGSCLSPPAGIVSWWQGEGGAVDSVGSNNGILAGGGAGYAVGQVGVAFSFTNGSGYVQIPDNPSLAFGMSDFSIELWAKFTSLGGTRAFLAKDEGPGKLNKWILWLDSGQLQFVVGTAGNSSLLRLGSGAFNPGVNQWHHVAVTRSGAFFAFYVDGALISTAMSTVAIPAINAPMTIGEAESSCYLGGVEDEVTIYNRALSANDVQAIYNAGSAGKCVPATPPMVVNQPANTTVFAGTTASLEVGVAGSPPLSYQWRLNGTNVFGATNNSLTLTNLQPGQSGDYSVLVSNAVNFTTSSNAVLTVISPGSCLPPPPGVVSWWRGEGGALDSAGSNNGTLAGVAGFAAGKVGVAFAFTNSSSYVQIPDNPSLSFGTNDFSIELWVKFISPAGNQAFIAKDEGSFLPNKWIFLLYNGQLQFVVGNAQSQSILGTGAFNPVLNHWHHVAVTRTGTFYSFYLDGNLSSKSTSTTDMPAVINAPVTLGQAENAFFMNGLEDEVTIYNRALTAVEVQAIYSADATGKCAAAMAPMLVGQPQSETVSAGVLAGFGVLAAGSPPLSYQWQFNNTNIPGATNAAFTLTNVQPGQGGNYSVVVSNAINSVISSNALLTVLPAGSCLPPPTGIVSWWQGEGAAVDSMGPNNGTLAGGAGYAIGQVGVAFSFTNGFGYVQIPDNPSLAFGMSDFSIELWAKFTSLGGTRAFIAKDEGPFLLNKWILWLDSGQLQFVVGTAGNSSLLRLGSGAFNPEVNQWHHVAVTRGGPFFSFYVDGALISTAMSIAAIPAINAPVTIGEAENSCYLVGLEDEVSIYNRALSAVEVQSIYSAGAAGKCAAPTGPVVIAQPIGQSVFGGITVRLNALATGSPPLNYQWRLNGINVSGATNNSLTLTNIQPAQSGDYSLLVSNAVNFTTSSNAVLAVVSPGSCLPLPPGVVSWWRGEASALDSAGPNNGTLAGGAGFAAGKVGVAFAFTNGSSFIQFPSNPSLMFWTNDFTIELWVNLPSPGGNQAFISKDDGPGKQNKWAFLLNNGQLQFLVGNGASQVVLGSGTFNPAPNHWYHVAVTRTGTFYSFYLDGNLNSTSTSTTDMPGIINAPLTLGQAENAFYMNGLEDEVTIYNRALSANEVQAIYSADAAGKCAPPLPPSVVIQPQPQTLAAGGNINLTVVAAGSAPLNYQWRLNNANVSGATNVTLILTNAQPVLSGNYSVGISNAFGFTNSLPALVTVYGPACASVAGLAGWWAAEGNALDSAGTNHGVIVNGAGFAPGVVGAAFDFNGFSQYVDVPDSASLNPASSVSVEAWVYPRALGSVASPIVKKAGEGSIAQEHGYTLEVSSGGVALGVFLNAPARGWFGSAPAPLPLNQWSHVAGVYDGTNLLIYVNGSLVGTPTPASGTLGASGNHLHIGHDPANPLRYFNGLVDEAAVYGAALSSAQIQAIYLAAYAGKCPLALPPSFATQPQSRAVLAGSGSSFSVLAGGSGLLYYQWQLNGTNLSAVVNPSATNSTLLLNNVQAAQGGNYSVIVTNLFGSAGSSNAQLTVLFPPAMTLQPASQSVQLGCPAIFSATASGTASLAYQWQKNGTNLPGQTATNLTLVRVQASDFGNYSMIASNSYGAATSSIAMLSLDHPPVPGGTIVQRYASGGVIIPAASVLANVLDADGDPLNITGVNALSVAGGTITLTGSLIYYSPIPGYTNADAFNYTVSDGHCGGDVLGIVLVQVPPDGNPPPSVTARRLGDGSLQLNFEGAPNRAYRVQSTGNLAQPDWQDVAAITSDQFGIFSYVDWPATNSAARFYRSVSP